MEKPLRAAFPDAYFSPEPLSDQPDRESSTVLGIFIGSRITAATLDQLPNVQYITTMSTGFDHIDLEACRARGIVVSNVPTYGEQTVAEHTVALLLALTRKIIPSVEATREGTFDTAPLRGVDLGGKVAGVIGTGHIGRTVIRMLNGLGMNVIAYDPFPNVASAQELHFTYVTLEQLLVQSDVVTLHCPATPATKHILNAEAFEKMKPSAFVINTARGSLLDSSALLAALEAGKLAGVGLDVLEEEQALKEEGHLLAKDYPHPMDLSVDHALLRHPRVIITPHNAFHSDESVARIAATTIKNIKAWLSHQPQNVVTT